MQKGFISSTLFLFIDNIVVAFTGWLFWIIIGTFSSATDLGISTYLFTLAAFISGILMLGFEFPLLKSINTNSNFSSLEEKNSRSQVFTFILLFEILLVVASIPLVLMFLGISYPYLDSLYAIATIMILVFVTIGSVSRYALLGVMSTKIVMLVNLISIVVRLVSAIFLLQIGQGAFAILFATVLQTGIIGISLSYVLISRLGLKSFDKKLISNVLIQGVSNFPGKVSKFMIAPISVVLLGVIGVAPAEIGLFFLSLIVTLVVSSFAVSLATISVPAKGEFENADNVSFRIGISLTGPFVILLIVFPGTILGLIKAEYAAGSLTLLLLGLAVVPSVIVFNVLTRLNAKNDNRNLILLGVLELGVFLLIFAIATPSNNSLGSAIAILISYLSSSVISVRWLAKSEILYTGKVCLAIILGVTLGLALDALLNETYALFLTLLGSLYISHLVRAINYREIKSLVFTQLRA